MNLEKWTKYGSNYKYLFFTNEYDDNSETCTIGYGYHSRPIRVELNGETIEKIIVHKVRKGKVIPETIVYFNNGMPTHIETDTMFGVKQGGQKEAEEFVINEHEAFYNWHYDIVETDIKTIKRGIEDDNGNE